MAPTDAILSCNEAITSGVVTTPDMASTLVNRGVLLMRMDQPQDAKRDFEQALVLAPMLPEALVNRGGILLEEGKPQEALTDLDRGIALGPEHPERAYYTRAMAREDLKDLKGAYADYKAAEALRPGWEPVVTQLSRFQVQARAK
ncbi:MAG TPA: tetratricopeptide repeat protein [Caulobacteraceae bacterium]|nr:tetratricopeptide repeat protein [Caulobacteraceae bacterium]